MKKALQFLMLLLLSTTINAQSLKGGNKNFYNKMKTKKLQITHVLIFLLTLSFTNFVAQTTSFLPYKLKSLPEFNLYEQHFIQQNVSVGLSKKNYKKKYITYYLNQDIDYNSLSDFTTFLALNFSHTGNKSRLIAADLSVVSIFLEYPNTMFFVTDNNKLFDIYNLNGFYRQSKFIPLPSSNAFRTISSLKTMFQKPLLTNNLHECKIQILFKTRIKKIESINYGGGKDNFFQTFRNDNLDDFNNPDSYMIDFDNYGNYNLISTTDTIKTYSVNWVDEGETDEVMYEITLKW